MFVRLGHCLLIVALLAATGGHWAILQSIAWTNMLADNLRNDSLSQALAKTFDGKHPCTLCKKISAGKKSEKKTEFPSLVKKLEFTHPQAPFIFIAPSAFSLAVGPAETPQSPGYTPPVPPPKPLLG